MKFQVTSSKGNFTATFASNRGSLEFVTPQSEVLKHDPKNGPLLEWAKKRIENANNCKVFAISRVDF